MNELETKIRSTHIQPATKILIYSHPHTHKEYLFVLLAQQQRMSETFENQSASLGMLIWTVALLTICISFVRCAHIFGLVSVRRRAYREQCPTTPNPTTTPHITFYPNASWTIYCAHTSINIKRTGSAPHTQKAHMSHFKLTTHMHSSSPPLNFSGSGSLGYQRRLGKRGSRALLWALTFPRRSKFMAHESLECEENFIGTWNEF